MHYNMHQMYLPIFLISLIVGTQAGQPNYLQALLGANNIVPQSVTNTTSNVFVNGRPVISIASSVLQQLPDLVVAQNTTNTTTSPEGLIIAETNIVAKALPTNLSTLVVLSSPTISSMIPPVQQLQSCDFDDSYRDILLVVNVARKALSNSPFANSISNGGIKNGNPVSLCMNGKLMMAAKLQSDFQALAKTPTHSGPRLSRLGSLEERLLWARFGLVGSPKIASPADSILDLDNLWQRQQQQSTETQQSKPNEPMTDCALFKQSKPSAEELIFFWPRGAGSLSQPIDRGLLRMRLKQAIRAWAADLPSVAILTNPTYRFFGAGYTRTQEGAMYLTVILGQANNEKCNLCPFDVSPVPPLPPSNDVIVEEEVIVYDS